MLHLLAVLLLLPATAAVARDLGDAVPVPTPDIGPRIYQSFHFPDDRLPVIDGDLSDWDIVGDAYTQRTWQLIEYNRNIGRDYDTADLDVRVRTGYNVSSNRIYVAVEYHDNFHNFDRVVARHAEPVHLAQQITPSTLGNDDIFELVLDADNSGGDFIGDLRARSMSTHTQNYHIYVHERDNAHVWVWGAQMWLAEQPWSNWASRYDGAHGSSGTSVLEFWVTPFNYADPQEPDRSAEATIAEGDTIGMSYAILDRDDEEDRVVKFWALADTILMYRDADFLPDFVLAPKEIRLDQLPVVEFLSRAPVKESPRTVGFVNTTRREDDVEGFVWHFGDGQTSSDRSPTHRYAAPGRYTVTLEAKGRWGSLRKRKLDYVDLW